MNKQKQLEDLQLSLISSLQNDSYITLEELAKKFNASKNMVHKTIMNISKLPGWSFTPSNSTPYAKINHLKRNRKKGDKYDHDQNESDWQRTYYHVHKSVE